MSDIRNPDESSFTQEQLRSLSIEVLRASAQDECRRLSIRAVAEQIGVGRTTLHNFVNEDTQPHPRIRRLLSIWYYQKIRGVNVDPDYYEALLVEIPPADRVQAIEDLIEFVRELHTKYALHTTV